MAFRNLYRQNIFENSSVGVTDSSTSYVQPPPIPPKTYKNQNQVAPIYDVNRTMGYTNPMGMFSMGGGYGTGYGMSGYGMYGNGMYGGGMYGNNNMMYGSYGNNFYNQGPPDNNYFSPGGFFQMMQSLVSPVVQNGHSLVNSLHEVTYTADSMFFSFQMLHRALIIVVNNLYKARDFIGRYLTSLATLGSSHFIFQIIKKILGLFNLYKSSTNNLESTWAQSQGGPAPSRSNILENIMILSTLIAAFSYLIPLIMNFVNNAIKQNMEPDKDESQQKDTEWDPTKHSYKTVQALYDFYATAQEELSIYKGQLLKMKPLDQNQQSLPQWVFVADESNKKGFVPISYLRPCPQQQNQNESKKKNEEILTKNETILTDAKEEKNNEEIDQNNTQGS